MTHYHIKVADLKQIEVFTKKYRLENMGGFTTNNKLITKQIVIIMFTGRATPHLAITRNWVDYIKRWMLFFGLICL